MSFWKSATKQVLLDRKMRDQFFEMFIEEMGEATSTQAVSQDVIDAWRGHLPNQLLDYWQQEGWGTYQHGLFRLVNPDEYEGIAREWLAGTPLAELDRFHVFACSAFGDLFFCGEKSGPQLRLMSSLAAFVAVPEELRHKPESECDLEMQLFFSNMDLRSPDLEDESGKQLFNRARKKLGDLANNEIYGFEPMLPAGGEMLLENLRKVDAQIHLSILRQIQEPSMPVDTSVFDLLDERDNEDDD